MAKRALAGVLWFLCGWYVGNWVAFLVGVTTLIGPVVGVAAVIFVVGDPFRVIWNRRAAEATRRVALHRLEEASATR